MDIIDYIGFTGVIKIDSEDGNLTTSQRVIISELFEKNLGVDSVYFNSDVDKQASFPAVFFKKVTSFDNENLQHIAESQRKIWNYKKVLFLYVYSDFEIRIYNCSEKPLVVTKSQFDFESELKSIEIKSYKIFDKDHLQELNQLFSRIAIDSGIIWTLEEAMFVREKINLQSRVDNYLVESLITTAQLLEKDGLELDFIHKIILRSLFLLYLEDREATDEKFYSEIKYGTKSYFDILDDVDATYRLFEKLEQHFNGNVFTLELDEKISVEQLKIIKQCFISGIDNTSQIVLFEDWRLFDFGIIQIELLSEIYENFLFETDPDLKKQTGTYYTPPALVEFILNEKLPVNNGEDDYNIKVLDPACGSGIFLVESFKRLVKRYENKHRYKLTDFDRLKTLLTDNIYGIELHGQAIKVAAFSLYLALVDNLNPKTIWHSGNYELPNLINNPKDSSLNAQGSNLFCRDTIKANAEIDSVKFDLVVGNPPFGTTDLADSIKEYNTRLNFAKEMVLPFLHKAIEFSPNGQIALIFNTKVLTNNGGTYQNFRNWLFNECYVEKVYNFSILRKSKKNFGGQLFGDATGPISIIYYQKSHEEPSDTITYYAPKTYIKSNVIEGLSIDFTDLKYLPRKECQIPNSKIWKVAMWGNINDWELIKSILYRTDSLKNYFKNDEGWVKPKVGLNGDSNKQDFIPTEIINPSLIQRYYTPEYASKPNKKLFRRIDESAFKPPFVIMKKGQRKKRLAASYVDYFTHTTTACYIFNGSISSEYKKMLVSVLNSSITTYILFLTSASWGIEREQVFMDEILESPSILPLLKSETVKKSIEFFDTIVWNIKENIFNAEIENKDLENQINLLILNDVIQYSETAKIIINDCLEYSLDLFENQEKSRALLHVTEKQTSEYSKILIEEINKFLDGEKLFVYATTYKINIFSPLMMIKLSFGNHEEGVVNSEDKVDEQLQIIDKYLWEEKAQNIYFRKKMNYKSGNDIFIIRPNQRRFWSHSMALSDASELILEILNGN